MANKTFLPTSTIDIRNGAGKFDFMCSNFDHKKLEFTYLYNGRQFKILAIIMFAYAEDGTKDRWIGMMSIQNPNEPGSFEERAYYYDTRTRTGSIYDGGKAWRIGAYQVVDNS